MILEMRWMRDCKRRGLVSSKGSEQCHPRPGRTTRLECRLTARNCETSQQTARFQLSKGVCGGHDVCAAATQRNNRARWSGQSRPSEASGCKREAQSCPLARTCVRSRRVGSLAVGSRRPQAETAAHSPHTVHGNWLGVIRAIAHISYRHVSRLTCSHECDSSDVRWAGRACDTRRSVRLVCTCHVARLLTSAQSRR